MFAKQEHQISMLNKHERTLQILFEKLSDACFDGDDRALVQDKLNQIKTLKGQLELALAKNKEIYNTQVEGVEKQLLRRETCLKQVDDVFVQFPELLQYFAVKQKTLRENLTLITNQLQET